MVTSSFDAAIWQFRSLQLLLRFRILNLRRTVHTYGRCCRSSPSALTNNQFRVTLSPVAHLYTCAVYCIGCMASCMVCKLLCSAFRPAKAGCMLCLLLNTRARVAIPTSATKPFHNHHSTVQDKVTRCRDDHHHLLWHQITLICPGEKEESLDKLMIHCDSGDLRCTILCHLWMFYYLHEHLHKTNFYIACLW